MHRIIFWHEIQRILTYLLYYIQALKGVAQYPVLSREFTTSEQLTTTTLVNLVNLTIRQKVRYMDTHLE